MVNRIAFLGPEGTFTWGAVLQYDPKADPRPFPTMPEVATAVVSGVVEEGMFPIENSLEGPVTPTMDILTHGDDGLLIRGELVLPIVHCLMVKSGTQVAQIQVIYSHPQALGQCREYLETNFPHARQVASLSTVAAVEDMKESIPFAAAISPKRAAELHGVVILAEGIQDDSSNATRFVVLGKNDHPPTGNDKTSLCFSFEGNVGEEAGLLYGALGEFALRRISLTKVESRPAKHSLGQYIFLVDCIGHREDLVVKKAIEALASRVAMLKVLGSYPKFPSGWREL